MTLQSLKGAAGPGVGAVGEERDEADHRGAGEQAQEEQVDLAGLAVVSRRPGRPGGRGDLRRPGLRLEGLGEGCGRGTGGLREAGQPGRHEGLLAMEGPQEASGAREQRDAQEGAGVPHSHGCWVRGVVTGAARQKKHATLEPKWLR
eukprot:CAMPEP_0113829976 /NCGR_PEP_ID=MMETSP0328-20130328/6089_1 /TAXON_ID=39455 /ORGANISM="Alexandrium minutum" /LENGTH=146 /DNA_ID=CAMNT_0000798071 /DNA_START=90 /DNA_END=528 /DNA_ORIENTATION=- /assembly_acc=CAM_ASM_000350